MGASGSSDSPRLPFAVAEVLVKPTQARRLLPALGAPTATSSFERGHDPDSMDFAAVHESVHGREADIHSGGG
jgi:hypothetical protein